MTAISKAELEKKIEEAYACIEMNNECIVRLEDANREIKAIAEVLAAQIKEMN